MIVTVADRNIIPNAIDSNVVVRSEFKALKPFNVFVEASVFAVNVINRFLLAQFPSNHYWVATHKEQVTGVEIQADNVSDCAAKFQKRAAALLQNSIVTSH